MRATRSDCTSQEPRRAVRITRLLFEIPICAFVTGGSSEIRRKIFRKSTKMEPKSIENRCKIDLGRFWAFKAVSETHWDALGIDPGRQKKAAGPILQHQGRATSTWEPAKASRAGPGTVPDDSGAIPEHAWCTERCRTRSRNDFALFWSRCAKARSLKFMRPRSVS